MSKSTVLNQKFVYKKFVMQFMKNGEKVKAEKIFEKLLFEISLRGFSPLPTIILAINNVKPLVEIRSVKIRGNLYSIPFPLTLKRQLTFAIRNLAGSSKSNIVKSVSEEIIKASQGIGENVKKTKALHKLARQNRLFTHYRWF
jgi:small subunit ribosomal protein S7